MVLHRKWAVNSGVTGKHADPITARAAKRGKLVIRELQLFQAGEYDWTREQSWTCYVIDCRDLLRGAKDGKNCCQVYRHCFKTRRMKITGVSQPLMRGSIVTRLFVSSHRAVGCSRGSRMRKINFLPFQESPNRSLPALMTKAIIDKLVRSTRWCNSHFLRLGKAESLGTKCLSAPPKTAHKGRLTSTANQLNLANRSLARDSIRTRVKRARPALLFETRCASTPMLISSLFGIHHRNQGVVATWASSWSGSGICAVDGNINFFMRDWSANGSESIHLFIEWWNFMTWVDVLELELELAAVLSTHTTALLPRTSWRKGGDIAYQLGPAAREIFWKVFLLGLTILMLFQGCSPHARPLMVGLKNTISAPTEFSRNLVWSLSGGLSGTGLQGWVFGTTFSLSRTRVLKRMLQGERLARVIWEQFFIVPQRGAGLEVVYLTGKLRL
ncbi:uncharacterized protein BDR25DRAFT_392124 [Lindgomyces ingoldianus]|uniref:Uncharacterized protein n=1 Tax=Lindgomyces ingoldianus TaxID=673940 RepID=A0ACB6R4V8_9PLEO|nr:uncharacterized protein BDR25DRAFT_392124 [Lindgomyces ingoldianus]KAF2473562.1 hypothetical protein BDR25DRAFT_392124 [Lindgomyces ingoldianus]